MKMQLKITQSSRLFTKTLFLLSFLIGFSSYATVSSSEEQGANFDPNRQFTITNNGSGELASIDFSERSRFLGQAGRSITQTPFTNVGDGLVAKTARSVLRTARTKDFQTWRLVTVGNNTVQIVNAVSNNAIGVDGANSIPLQQAVNSSNRGQLWNVEGSGNATRFRNVLTGKFLSVNSDNRLVQQNSSGFNTSQQWSVSAFVEATSVSLMVAPNPTRGRRTTAFITSNVAINNVTVRVTDQFGAVIASRNVNLKVGVTEVPLSLRRPTSRNPTGYVAIRLSNGEQLTFKSIVVR
ncbi:RICIN domain-containing protein [Aquimarina agarilytica]|uniref:RICIN domain-containing protein n=1 Tax=Aquimarina agarilytica TaxID=1087449 RepID=UPI0002896E01|nr:RICIN domain-containing protein [Aquimarina agarilytica]